MVSKKEILRVIKECYDPSPSDKAAQILHAKGVDSTDLWTNTYNLEDSIRIAVANSLRDIERKEKEKPHGKQI
jgi:hypothetical protein